MTEEDYTQEAVKKISARVGRMKQLSELGAAVAVQLAYRSADYCDTGAYAGKFRYREYLYLSADQVDLIEKIRQEARYDR